MNDRLFKKQTLFLFVFLVSALFSLPDLFLTSALAHDWPQFRYGAERGAASPEQLPETMHLQWVKKFAAPKPAYPNEVRLRYDETYEPVILGRTMFVPSMITDSVTAFDIRTGKLQWRFFTGGPVRFAPAAGNGRVFFTSDDGYLYCVSAKSGKLQWKFRGLPADRQDRFVLGHGRLISLRPARGAPVLKEGVVYFGAGIWLGDGIFIHAIDAKTGKAIWSNTDSHLIKGANVDHYVQSTAGLSPQGYLAVLGKKLVVPCGAQLPGFLDTKTGKTEPYTMGWGGRHGLPKGSWFLAGTEKYLMTSGDLYDLTRPISLAKDGSRGKKRMGRLFAGEYLRLLVDPENRRELDGFQQPIMTPTTMYRANKKDGTFESISLQNVKVVPAKNVANQPAFQGVKHIDHWTGQFTKNWDFKTNSTVHIKSGLRLYAGGKGFVEAIDLPRAGKPAKVSWRTKITGTPHRMLTADGRLFVVTKEGQIYAFGDKPKKEVTTNVKRPFLWCGTARFAAATQMWPVLAATKKRDGFVVLFGSPDMHIVQHIISQTKFFVIVVSPDASQAKGLRDSFTQFGTYGTRVSVHIGDPKTVPLPPYFADLVVVDKWSTVGKWDSKFSKTVFQILRPYGGTAVIGELSNTVVDKTKQTAMIQQIKAAKLPKAVVKTSKKFVVLTREGALPKSSNWSFDSATVGNAGASHDQFLKAPLGILWFDGSIRWYRSRGAANICVAGGRVFVKTEKTLRAIDVYTGRHHWDFTLGNKERSTGFAALDKEVYVAYETYCAVFNAATGKRLRNISFPIKKAPAQQFWTRLRVQGDYLTATLGTELLVMNRLTGKLLWKYQFSEKKCSVALSKDRLFFSETVTAKRKPRANVPNDPFKTKVFDLKTGKIIWKNQEATTIRYSPQHDFLVTENAVYRAKNGAVVYKHQRPLKLFSIAGDMLISSDALRTQDQLMVQDLATGKVKFKTETWFRRGCTLLRMCPNLATTRFRGNAAYLDFTTKKIQSLWNIRSGCNNNLVPANGVLNVPNLTGGCECNYTPTSLGLIPESLFRLEPKKESKK